MPTDRYRKLKSKKRKFILESIQESLEMKDVSDLSVKDIVEVAEISRGTFYTYFQDLKDAVFALLTHHLNIFFEKLKLETEENNRDLMKTLREQYVYVMDFFSDKKYFLIIKNLRKIIDASVSVEYFNDFNNYTFDVLEWFLNNTDIGEKLKDKNKAYGFFNLMSSIFVTAIFELSIGHTREDIDKETYFKFDIVEKGLQ